VRRALRTAAAVCPGQQIARHVPGELSHNAAPGADAHALMVHVVFSGVVNIAPAERPKVISAPSTPSPASYYQQQLAVQRIIFLAS